MLKLENISTSYGKKQVLFDVSFEIGRGEIALLVGSNGSGKSSLLKSIFGLLPIQDSGQILFKGENIVGKPTATLLKKGLLYIPQKGNLYEDLTVKENLEMAGLTLDRILLKQRIENTISTFPTLQEGFYRIPMKLSGGERQLLTLAMANLHDPSMLLIDEPYTGLSPHNLAIVTENLKMLNKQTGMGMLIVEHRIKECLAIGTKIIGLKLGRVLKEIPIEKDFNLSQIQEIFN